MAQIFGSGLLSILTSTASYWVAIYREQFQPRFVTTTVTESFNLSFFSFFHHVFIQHETMCVTITKVFVFTGPSKSHWVATKPSPSTVNNKPAEREKQCRRDATVGGDQQL